MRQPERNATDDLVLARREPDLVERERRPRMEAELPPHQGHHAGVDLGLGGELGDAGDHELRHADLERRLGARSHRR